MMEYDELTERKMIAYQQGIVDPLEKYRRILHVFKYVVLIILITVIIIHRLFW